MRKKIFLIVLLFAVIAAVIFSCTPLRSSVSPEGSSNPAAKASGTVQFQTVSLNRNEERTRNASVKIYTERGGHGSGAYFIYEGYHVVFTAAHVTAGGESFLVVDRLGNKRFGTLVYTDAKIDFSVILIPAFEKIKPIKFKTPSYDPTLEIGKRLIFSGYPGRQSLRTTRGLISGVEGRHFVMHSTAWGGSSGSCVFDSDGNFVGILFAVTLGRHAGASVLLESMAWVEPYNVIDWMTVSLVIKSLN